MLFILTIIVVFFFFTTSRSLSSSPTIPYLKVKGSHFSAFHQVGKHFKSQISSFLSQYKHLNDTLLPFYQNRRKDYDAFVETIETVLPGIYEEIRGLAEGSGQEFHVIMLLQLRTEIIFLKQTEKTAFEDCTDIHVREDNDGDRLNKDLTYFVEVTIEEGDFEHFVALCYPGVIPGVAYGWNKHGLTLSGNAVTPKYVEIGGIPKMLMYRVGFRAKSFADAVRLLNGVEPRAFGMSIHFGNIHTGEHQLVEVSQEEVGIRYIVGNYSHMNNYRILNIPFTNSESSVHRQKRVDEITAPKNAEDIRAILGDTKDPDFPLYRTTSTSTLSTAVYDLNEKTVKIYTDNPKTSEPVQSYSLKLD